MSSSESAVAVTRCPKCDAEVRDASTFCYNCGGRVTAETALTDGETSPETPYDVNEKNSAPAPGMRSARDIRRQRTFERKQKQIVWEPNEKGPDIQLIVITAAVLIFTIVVILLVSRLR